MVAAKGMNSLAWTLLVLVILFLLLSSALGALGEIEYSDHAVRKHGQDAIKARITNSNRGFRHDCNNGKQYYIAPMEDGKFAITIVQGGREKTSFVTRSFRYIQNALKRDGCRGQYAR